MQFTNCLCHAFKRQCTLQSLCKNASRILLTARITPFTIQVNLNFTSLHKPRGKFTLTFVSESNIVTAFYTLTTRYEIPAWMQIGLHSSTAVHTVLVQRSTTRPPVHPFVRLALHNITLI